MNVSVREIISEKKNIYIIAVVLFVCTIIYGINQNEFVKVYLEHEVGISGVYSVFDVMLPIVGDGAIIGPLSLVTIVIPTYIILLLKIISNGTTFYKFRLKTRKNIWKHKVGTVILLSSIYSILIILFSYIVGGIISKDIRCVWENDNSIAQALYRNIAGINSSLHSINYGGFMVMCMTFIILFLGLVLIGVLVNLLNNIINKKIIVFIVLYGLCLYEVVLQSNFSILVNKMYFKYIYMININSYLYNLIILIILIISSYVGGLLLEEQDEDLGIDKK